MFKSLTYDFPLSLYIYNVPLLREAVGNPYIAGNMFMGFTYNVSISFLFVQGEHMENPYIPFRIYF